MKDVSVIVKKLEFNNNSSTNTYNNINNVPANDIIDKNIRDLEIEFGIYNIAIKDHRLPNMYWMSRMHKNTTKQPIQNDVS